MKRSVALFEQLGSTRERKVKALVEEGFSKHLITRTVNHRPLYELKNIGLCLGFGTHSIIEDDINTELAVTLLILNIELQDAISMLRMFREWPAVKKILEPTYAYLAGPHCRLEPEILRHYQSLLESLELSDLIDDTTTDKKIIGEWL